ncbi:hypothetical protein L3Y34_011603 [Caenorhabditis briggsae]|uniref:Major facilitator superfamily (MFS) profile domain-containing protein n=1 Tax=Caenorhabditis briggsae TaxID=6238 RepID=A0AAE8ZRP7_CAEBR|nr:hypothetical protein L3Y34_011603 [Caenorhabditis briggsae]
MKFSVPKNILLMIACFLLLDTLNQVQTLMFSTLAEVITEMNNHTLMNHFGLEPTETRLAMMNSIMTTTHEIGNALSIIFLLPVADYKGRTFAAIHLRFGITIAVAVCQLLAAWFQASEIYILGQFILGFTFCLRTFGTQIFILECAPDNCRGFASTALIFSFVFGKLIMFSTSSPSLLGTSSLWFIFPLFVMISSVVVYILLLRFPDSPKWLVQQKRVAEAIDAIRFYHGAESKIYETVNNVIKENSLTKENKLSLKQVWENDTLRQSCLIILANMMFMQFDTSYVLSIYTIMFHNQAGFTTQMAMNINLIITIVLLPTKFVGTILLDTLGRRPTFFIAGIMQYTKSILIFATSIIIFISGSSLITQIMYLGVEFLAVLVPATGVNSILVLFVSELFPPSARTSVGQAMMFGSMLINTPIVSVFPIVNSIFPPIFFVPFVITQVIFGIYLYRNMPETRGRAVYDIIESMDNEVGSRAASILDEKLPLIRNRARTLASKRNSILNIERSRAVTFDHKFTPEN